MQIDLRWSSRKVSDMRRWGYTIPLLLPLLMVFNIQQGGAWLWAPVVFVFGLVPLLDILFKRDTWNPSPEEAVILEADLFYRVILYAWVPMQLLLLGWLAWQVRAFSLQSWEFVAVCVSTGTITGALGITIAHELGHKLDRREQWLARILLMSVCYMHFHVEHNKGHHARVATPDDPASARRGQSLYAFLPQTIAGSFRSAWHYEKARLAKAGSHGLQWRNQVLWGIAGSGAMFLVAMVIGGAKGGVFFVAQSFVAIFLLEVVNYIEHYGLRREPRESGGYVRVEVFHSWNASERFTNWFLFNLQRHSHHHVAHHRRYQVLRSIDASPQLPTGYAGMVLLALVPPLWKRIMNHRLAKWSSERYQQ